MDTCVRERTRRHRDTLRLERRNERIQKLHIIPALTSVDRGTRTLLRVLSYFLHMLGVQQIIVCKRAFVAVLAVVRQIEDVTRRGFLCVWVSTGIG